MWGTTLAPQPNLQQNPESHELLSLIESCNFTTLNSLEARNSIQNELKMPLVKKPSAERQCCQQNKSAVSISTDLSRLVMIPIQRAALLLPTEKMKT
jgi:hypothetical protein